MWLQWRSLCKKRKKNSCYIVDDRMKELHLWTNYAVHAMFFAFITRNAFFALSFSLSVTREKEKKGSEMEKMKKEELNGGYHGWWETMHCTVHTSTHVWIILSVSVWNSFITVHWLLVSTHSRELKIHSHILVRNTLMSTLRVLLFVCIIHIFFSKGSTTLRNVRATCWTSSMSL